MHKLTFERRKYGHELLIDACSVDELNIVGDTLVQSFYTIMLLEECNGTYHLDSEVISLTNHSILFVKPGQINQVSQAEFHKGHFLFFEGDFLDEFFHDKNFIYKFGYFHNPSSSSCLLLAPDTFEKYNRIAAEIREEIHHLTADSHHILRSLIYYLLVRLHQLCSQADGSSLDILMEPKVLQFVKLMEGEIKGLQTVQEFADRLRISRVHLNNLCKKYFSKTAHQLIREHLLAEIKREIQYSDKDLSTISYQFNFSAPSHFSRFFKQMMDMTPQAYRETLSKW